MRSQVALCDQIPRVSIRVTGNVRTLQKEELVVSLLGKKPGRGFATGRFAAAALIALPVTIALLFLMTRLILPGDEDPLVARMIQDIEFQRVTLPPEPISIQAFRRPPEIEEWPLPERPIVSRDHAAETEDKPVEEDAAENSRVQAIDWWAEARRIAQESDEDALERWLQEQGYEKYVTIMQGPLPITNSVQATLPDSQEDITGYMNSYGDMEIKVSENCVAQTQVSARLDISDFAEKMPMRVLCKPRKKIKYSFDRGESD